MFTLTYTTHSGISKTISVIEEQYVYQMFKAILHAVDLCEATIIDGFTGEVVMQWEKGEFNVINRCVL